ncbi:MAG: aspartate:alanine exchanger family transporter [Candidatus Sericytochromatia bacterium]
MKNLLIENPLLLLFVVISFGYALGKIKILGFNLGVAAVLFTGLAIGSLSPEFKIPEIIYRFGLVLFVYTVGLSSGPSFFSAFKTKGLRDNIFILIIISIAGIITSLFWYMFNLKSTIASGIFCGSLTSTPALAGALDYIKETNINNPNLHSILSEPVVGYSVTYPAGVIGMILTIYFFQRFWKIDYKKEVEALPDLGMSNDPILSMTVKITNKNVINKPHEQIFDKDMHIVFGRIKRNNHLNVVSKGIEFEVGDLVSIIGYEKDIDEAAKFLGEICNEKLEFDRHAFDFRRIFVSSNEVIGKHIKDLNLNKYGAIITRVRRGDIDFLAEPQTVLEAGDRVRVVAPRTKLDEITHFLGDSYKELSEIDVISFGMGITAGLLLGSIPITIYEGFTFKLGFAGGVLISGLILGKLGKTGPFLWQIPYNANLTLRQIGTILFLAGIGVFSGYSFVSTISQGNGLLIFLAGVVITFTSAILTLFIGYKFLKIPMGILIGILSGLQTQPAVLAFANEQTNNLLPNRGYTNVYPFAMIAKIVITQIILSYLV